METSNRIVDIAEKREEDFELMALTNTFK